MARDTNPCMRCGKQHNGLFVRGLCSSCYQLARKYVQAGNTTWKELESLGKVRVKRQTFAEYYELKKENLESNTGGNCNV